MIMRRYGLFLTFIVVVYNLVCCGAESVSTIGFSGEEGAESIKNAPEVHDMVFIEGGEYSSRVDGKRVNTMIQSFYLDKRPVTIAQFAEFVQATGYRPVSENPEVYSVIYSPPYKIESRDVDWRYDERGNIRDSVDWHYPVLYVAHVDAKAYAEWAGKRLPTMYEWQYAAEKGLGRAGNIRRHLADNTWNSNNTGKVEYSGQKGADILGLYDMLGNIQEHVDAGIHQSDIRGLPEPLTSETLVRIAGGSFFDDYDDFWPVEYVYSHKWSTTFTTGFRCAMDIPDID